MEQKKLCRASFDKKIFGVCGAPSSLAAARYFKFFKPQHWRKRSVVRGWGFIQRFPNPKGERIMEQKKLCRASFDKKIFGVCGGIAHYFGLDSTLVRLITVLLVFLAGLSLWVYIIAALIMPETNEY